MSKNIGIQLASDGDLLLAGGLHVGEISAQNQFVILSSHKGELKLDPTLGVGLSDMVNDNDETNWRWEIIEGLKADGFVVNKVSFGDAININASYR